MTGDEQFEVVQKAWAAFSAFDLEGGLALLHEDAEVIPFGAAMEGRRYLGHDGIRRWFEQEIWSSWEWFQTIPEAFRIVGDGCSSTGAGVRVGRRAASTSTSRRPGW